MKLRSYLIIISICATLILFFGLFNRLSIFKYQNNELQRISDIATLTFENNIETYIYTLYGARGLMNNKNTVSRLEFNHFVSSLDLAQRLPGVNSVGYAKLVTNDSKATYLAEVKNDTSLDQKGYPEFSIRPDIKKSEYLVSTYLESSSFSDSRVGLGFDLLSEEERKSAYEFARDNNRATMTHTVTSAASGESIFILMLPIFEQGKPVISVEDRQASVTGIVALGLKRAKLFNASFQTFLENESTLQIKIYDGTEINESQLVYNSNQDRQVLGLISDTLSLKVVKTVKKANKTWTIEFSQPQRPTVFLIPYFVMALPLFVILGLSVFGLIRIRSTVRTSSI